MAGAEVTKDGAGATQAAGRRRVDEREAEGSPRRRRVVRPLTLLVSFAMLPLVVSVGASSAWASTAAHQSKSTATIAVFDPFSGPDAGYGYGELAGCVPAASVINKAGGVLGHNLQCTIFDDRGDPADAVPATEKMLLTSGVVGIITSNSGIAPATVPIINHAKKTDLSAAGDNSLNRSTYKYFWRILPADDVEGYALATWAHMKGYKRVASIFANDVTAQGNVPGLLAGSKNLHVKITTNQAIASDQTSYETEITTLRSNHPQAMAMESDAQTAAVLLGQMKQSGKLMPFIGTPGDYSVSWKKAVTAAIGKADFKKYITIVNNYSRATGPLWKSWDKALLASCSKVPNCKTYTTTYYSENAYDGATVMALAMAAAKSTNSTVYNPYIRKVTQPTKHSVVVHTFQQGVQQLKRGKHIQYVGLTGVWLFDKFQNNPGIFAGFQGLTNHLLQQITPRNLLKAEHG